MKRMKNLFAPILAIVLLVAVADTASAQIAGISARAILSWTECAETTMTVTWVGGADTDSVRFAENRDLVGAREAAGTPTPNKSAIEETGVRMTATLTDLTPGVTYWYSVCSGGVWSEPVPFTTAQEETDSFSFMYFGDIQVAKSTAEDYAAWGRLATNAYGRNSGAAFALQGGDIVESGISREQWAAFLDNASPVFSRIPFLPTNGNHESNFLSGKPELYLDTFTLPQNGPDGFKEEFYSFDYGNAHITVLNDWVFSGEQRLTDAQLAELDAWVEADLVRSDATWKIVVTHVPIYAIHSDTTANRARAHWAPIFEKYGVSLVLVGHQHVYSRLEPLTGGKIDYENGVTYIMGNSGMKHYSSADETLAARTIYDTANYQVIHVDGGSATVQTFDGDGNELDYVALFPRTVGNVTRAEAVAALYRAEGSPETGGTAPFIDVPDYSPYSGALAWAAENGIVFGVGGGRFEPDSIIRPEHMRLIMARLGATVCGE